MPAPIRVKIISPWLHAGTERSPLGNWRGLEFIIDPACEDYDWLLVYDELVKGKDAVKLKCPPERTILVTQEPPSIKVYPPYFTRQFQYVLTTHDKEILSHPGYLRGRGCFVWLNGHSFDWSCEARDFPKSEEVATVLSAKSMKHTEHHKRFALLSYLEENLTGFKWYGARKQYIKNKYDALDTYRYNLALENHIHPYHWSEKIADALMSLCLPFYAGDPCIEEVLPAESFIRISMDEDPKVTLAQIQEAIANDEYSKRLPAIKEARRRLIEEYNLFAQVHQIITKHEQKMSEPHCWKASSKEILGRRRLRRRPWNTISGLIYNIRCRLLLKKKTQQL